MKSIINFRNEALNGAKKVNKQNNKIIDKSRNRTKLKLI